MVEIGSRDDSQPYVRTGPDEVLGSGSASGRRRWLPDAAPVYGWGVAAALAIAAPFAAVNTLEVHLPNGRIRVASVDGWGSDHPHHALQVGHDVRFGIALWACAIALIAAAALALSAMRASERAVLLRRGVLASIAAPSALLGVVASVVLTAQTFVDRFDALSVSRAPALTAGEAVYQPGYGLGVWLSVAAVVIAVLSSSLFLRRLLLEPVAGGAGFDPASP